MKMELGIEIKFIFQMEIMFGWYNIAIRVANPPALKRFKYLADKISAMAPDQESATVLTLFRGS